MPVLERSVLVDVSTETAHGVITDIEAYPDFLPACTGAVILHRASGIVTATVEVSGMGLQESFTTRNVETPERVIVELENGPFHHLRGEWSFKALAKTGCRVSLVIDYRPKGVLARVLSGAAPVVADKLVEAFVERMRWLA